MSRTTAKIGLFVLGFVLSISALLVVVDPELGVTVRRVLAGGLMLAGIASMVKALVLGTDAPPARHRAAGVGSRR